MKKHLFLMCMHRGKIAWRHHVYCDEIQAIEEGQAAWNEERYSRMVDLEYDLDELMDYIDQPIAFLPDNLYRLAQETVSWVAEKRGRCDKKPCQNV